MGLDGGTHMGRGKVSRGWDLMTDCLSCICLRMSRMDQLWTGATVALVSVGLT
jgi:hypothetical protein